MSNIITELRIRNYFWLFVRPDWSILSLFTEAIRQFSFFLPFLSLRMNNASLNALIRALNMGNVLAGRRLLDEVNFEVLYKPKFQ